MTIQYFFTDELKEYDNNPRINDNAVDAVANSIKEFGFKVPIVIDKDNVIIAGHTRLKAAKMLGLENVPCIVADDLTPEQVKAFRIADNKTGEIAEWDLSLLEQELSELQNLDFEMGQFGFDDVETLNAEVVEVEVPEIDEENEPITKRGDVWKLGNHRIMCGDSTSVTDMNILLDNKLSDLVVTDPPYNMAYEGAAKTPQSKRIKNKILNDDMSDKDFEIFLISIYKTMLQGMKDGASCYVFYKELGKGVFITSMLEAGITFKQELIWVKNQIVLGGSKYQNMYESCLFGCKGKSVENWYAGRKERSVIESINTMNEFELRDAIRDLLNTIETDIVRENKTLKNDLHPTMKPIKLLAKFIRNSSKENDIVLDLFGGSGSTLIACEQLNRNCVTMELDERYCDVIIKRWETFTSKKAELLQ